MKDGEQLNIVDEQGNIIGVETREKIHELGLLHREIHVWFYTPRGEIIFQHRAKDKDTYPDLLDATVGGHVEIGMDFLETAVKEVEEETGVNVKSIDLKFIEQLRTRSEDSVTERINNVIKREYAYCYTGNTAALRIEQGKAIGFELWLIDRLMNLTEDEQKRFIPGVIESENLQMLQRIILE
jgi:isopentenyldiphosphate isomerase